MNRRKAATVRRVVPSKYNENDVDDDDDVIFMQENGKNKMADKPPAKEGMNEVVVAVDIHQIPQVSSGKDDNQNYIPPASNTKQIVEVKNKAATEKKNKVSLNAVLARLSPLKRQMKAAMSLKAGATKSLLKSSPPKTKASLNPILASKIQQQASNTSTGPDDIEVLEQNIAVSNKGQDKAKKKRRPSVKANLSKKNEAMKPSTKMALKAKIKQKEPTKSKEKDAKLSPVALPPAPGALIQSSPMNNSSVLGTCFLLPVKKEPLDNDALAEARSLLKPKSRPLEDLAPLDLTTSRKEDSLCSSGEEIIDSEDDLSEDEESEKPQTVTPSNAKKRKQEETPSENAKKPKKQSTPALEKILNTPAVNARTLDLTKLPTNMKTDITGLPPFMLPAVKKTARKSIRDPTPSPVKSTGIPEPMETSVSPPTAAISSVSTQPPEGDLIFNQTKLEGSNTQIIVKQENNEIVIRIAADNSNNGNEAEADKERSLQMKIATAVDRAVREAASKALLNVNSPFNLSEEETDENLKINANICQTTELKLTPKPPVRGEKTKECPICGKVFNRGGNLVGHMRKHTGERPYVCEICNKGFTFLTNLRAHMNVHTGERPYKCKECDKAYTQLCGLQRHMASHSDAKPFVCGTCQKAFKHLHVLRRHELVHGDYRPYRCLTCGKGFLHAWHLEKHVRVHTGDRPYKCNHCDSAFTQKSGLVTHLERAHFGMGDGEKKLSAADGQNQVPVSTSVNEESENSQEGSTEMDADSQNAPGSDENGNKITNAEQLTQMRREKEDGVVSSVNETNNQVPEFPKLPSGEVVVPSNETNTEVSQSPKLSAAEVGTAYARESNVVTEVFIKQELQEEEEEEEEVM